VNGILRGKIAGSFPAAPQMCMLIIFTAKSIDMKKNLFALPLVLLASLLIWQCQLEDGPSPQNNLTFDCQKSPAVCTLGQANNDFGFKIFQKLHSHDPAENLFISPTSIATALTMALNGAQGETAAEMKRMLELNNLSLEEVNAAYQAMLPTLPALDYQVDLNIANSLWYRRDFPVKQSFLDLNQEYFKSQVSPLDFDDPAAKDIINGWVDNQTKGLINSIVDEIPQEAIMYLINAIYFKGNWRKSFDPEKTYSAPFVRNDASEVPVQMMDFGGTVSLPLYVAERCYVVDLAYGDSVYSMTLIVPREGYTVADVISQLDGQSWKQWLAGLEVQELLLQMPKFKMEYEQNLNRALQELGMTSAFNPRMADFSNIAEAELSISQVRHKSFVEVDEQGTKAAAVTSIEIVLTSLPSYPTIILNRPFLFAIRENQAGNVLFLGKMMDPQE
jgi:serine protease inhibitor